MGRVLHILAGVLVITVIVIGVLNWLVNDNPTVSFLKKQTISYIYSTDNKISNIDIEFDDGKVFLNVHTLSPMTCDEVKSKLGIQTITIKNKAYIPNCTLENDSLIQVTYIKDNSV